MSFKLLFDGGRVQIENDGNCAIWLDEGDALLLAHALTERLTVPSRANPRLTWPKGYGPADGNAEWDFGNG